MKKFYKLAVLLVAASTLMVGCNKSDIPGFKKTKSGLHYKFEVCNDKEAQVQKGDALVVEMTLKLDTTFLTSNVGSPQRMAMSQESMFQGDLSEGLLMMHKGDKATFAVEADSLAKFFPMPDNYTPNQGMKMYYEIHLIDIVSEEELKQEEANFHAEMERRQTEEPTIIAQYIADNNITVDPNADGLYVIVNKKGHGPVVATGKTVRIDYTGRLLDGTIFDSSVESDAKEGGVYNPNRPYEPLEYVVGQMALIKGWDTGVMGLPEGSEVTLVFPSALGYGNAGTPDGTIPPYSPLRFDIKVVSVK